METPRRLALIAVLFGVAAPLTSVASANPHHGAMVRDHDASEVDVPDEVDDPSVLTAPAGGDPFCPTDADPEGLDEVDVPNEPDPAYMPGDILDEDVPDEPYDLDAILDFCSDGAVPGQAAKTVAMSRVLQGLTVPTDSMNVSVPGTITRQLRLSQAGLPKTLRGSRSMAFGAASKVARSDGFLDLDLRVNARGRHVLRKATSDVRMVLETTETLASGQQRTRTQVLLLKR